MTTDVVLDLAVIGLIGAAALYGAMLSRKLQKLGQAQDDLRGALDAFAGAAQQADAALKRIETVGVVKGAELHAAAQRAQNLATDLSVMTSAGERVADRIEAALRDVRTVGGAARKDRRAA